MCRAEKRRGKGGSCLLPCPSQTLQALLLTLQEEAGVVFLGGERTAYGSSQKTARGWEGQRIGGGIEKDLTSLNP